MTRVSTPDSSTITCPKCGHEFPLSAAIEQPIMERVKRESEALAIKQLEAEVAKAVAKERESSSLTLEAFKQEISEKNRKIDEFNKAQLELMKQKRVLEEQKNSFELEKQKQLDAEREKIRSEATKLATEAASRELLLAKQQMELKDKKLAESQKNETELLKSKVELEERQKGIELEVARKSEEARQAANKAKDEEFRLEKAAHVKLVEDMKKQMEEVKRKAEQGSQQSQGEVLELDLENQLRQCFPQDEITEVRKGALGADMKQLVRDGRGNDCGSILWESKRTKAWTDTWLPKLKEDRMREKADIAALVSTTMPRDVSTFECRDNIWIMPPGLMLPVAATLRMALIEASVARRSVEGRSGKQTDLYNYVVGPQFRARVEVLAEVFVTMREELNKEKSAFQRIWSRREKQIERLALNTTELCGDVEGIVGKALPGIKQLELPSPTDQPADELEEA